MRAVKALVADFSSYLWAVFVEAWHLLFTALDIVGLILFLNPQIAQRLTDEGTTRMVGALLIVASFVIANFLAWKKARRESIAAEAGLLVLVPHHVNFHNAVRLKYVGVEPVTKKKVLVQYRNTDGTDGEKEVKDFCSQNDPTMWVGGERAYMLDPGQTVYFQVLLTRSEVLDGSVHVRAEYIGVRSQQLVVGEEDIPLEF